MNYLITGATGELGGHVLTYLKELVPKENIYGLARNPKKAETLKAKGFKVRLADYENQEALSEALEGIDRLLLISGVPGNRQQEHKNVIDAAKKAGIEFIAYTSLANAMNANSQLAEDHAYTERVIKKSGLKHTILRNNWYLENELPVIGAALSSGKFVYSAGEGKVGWALRREYGEAAAIVLSGKTEYPEILELSGTPVDYRELARAVKEASGKDFDVSNGGDNEFIENLTASGLPEKAAEVFLSFQHDIKNKKLDVSSDDFEKVLDRPLTPLAAAVKELLD
ncbi:SDR family oxidoreductase [Enterococcus sp. CWB-B31]|uniref:SDR family oxidoreductase n=1 Tax=Enterococcus sp. CWB-B31 TaxID=2885159 RepID=UPI001E3EBA12|nr:SDR family oxidoreductase [Enterococcus sp. CWB-B31]MCB5955632.1 SDR family oxidoreductase [Enterococcus sp. CWB-B31]